jgi:hypothetical protein
LGILERITNFAVSRDNHPVTEKARMTRILSFALAGTTALGLSAGAFTGAQAAPMPAMNVAQVGGGNATVDTVRYRGGYGYGRYGGGYGRGYYGGYRRGPGIGGALAAGAALGIIGGAIAASQAPRYGYYDRGYYDGGYAGVGYGGGYAYGAPAYGYYSAPTYGYGYPAYGYGY